MTKEQIQEYTVKISRSNRTELVVVLFEICMTYLDDAVHADDYVGFKAAVQRAQKVVRLLGKTLDYQYEIAFKLSSIYDFVNRDLSLAIVKNSKEDIPALKRTIENLYKAFDTVAKQEKSAPLMQNIQEIYAGLTYGRKSLNETVCGGNNRSRGYLV